MVGKEDDESMERSTLLLNIIIFGHYKIPERMTAIYTHILARSVMGIQDRWYLILLREIN